MLSMKQLVPVRLLRNKFYNDITAMEVSGASKEQMSEHLGKGRARKGMLEGDMDEGELEIGQVAGMIHDVPTVAELVARLRREYNESVAALPRLI